MNSFQKGALAVIFSVLIVISWLVNVFLHFFVEVEGELVPINPELQGLAIAAICLIVGISTPVGSAIAKGARKVGNAVKGGISGMVK